jgi:hypothetical protein
MARKRKLPQRSLSGKRAFPSRNWGTRIKKREHRRDACATRKKISPLTPALSPDGGEGAFA